MSQSNPVSSARFCQECRTARKHPRLWQSSDKRQQVDDLLAPVYDWFAERFDTVDLQEATQLLDELSAEIK